MKKAAFHCCVIVVFSLSVSMAGAEADGKEPPSDRADNCARAVARVRDGHAALSFPAGRKLAQGRGSQHAFVEMVIHENGEHVLALEARDGASSAHLAITLTSVDPTKVTGEHTAGYIEYARPGSQREAEEFRVDRFRVHITRFGAVGELVEGTFEPVVGKNRAGDATRLSGRFRVCRIDDWHVRK